jgi:hypothetical protein
MEEEDMEGVAICWTEESRTVASTRAENGSTIIGADTLLQVMCLLLGHYLARTRPKSRRIALLSS